MDDTTLADKTKYPLILRTRTPKGERVHVRYRRIPVRDGFDIEAKIISPDASARPAPLEVKKRREKR